MSLRVQAPAGPLLHATLIVADASPLITAYRGLGLRAEDGGAVSAGQATAWGQPRLAGCAVTWLTPHGAAAPLLRLITVPGTAARPARHSHGWLALEILVRDVDALAPRVAAAGFEIVGPPADLDVSPVIRAMQAIGPAGEMLYLTQVKAPVPPFAIPLSSELPSDADIGPLFIAVMSTPSREAVIEACVPLNPAAVLRFETKITVLNRALGHELSKRWPVATLQWGGLCLFEIDEVVDAGVQTTKGALPGGLAWVSMKAAGESGTRLTELSPGAWLEGLA
jgi:hypothetical protein